MARTRATTPGKVNGSRITVDGPRRVAIYLRQSLDSTGKGLAVARQRKLCEELCAARGWTVVAVYNDNDRSASGKRVRPEFERMLTDATTGAFDVIVSYHLDRLTRSLNDYLPLLDLADHHKVGVTTVSGEIDMTTDMGQTIAGLLAVIARGEIRRKGQRQVDANEERASKGEPHQGGARPVGYDSHTDSETKRRYFTVRESEAVHVRAAYADLLAGRGLSAIARDLNAAGLLTTKRKTKRAGLWTHGAVRTLLRNPRYAGLRVHRGEILGKAAWDSIVDEPTWRAAVAILGDPARRTTPHGGGTRKHLGVSLYRCGMCADGTTMVTEIGAADGNRERRKYQCRTGKHLVRVAAPIDLFVVDAIVRRVRRDDAADLLVDTDRPDLAALRVEATDLRTRLDDLAAAFADGEVTGAQLRVATARLTTRLAVVEDAMTHTDRAAVLADLVTADDPLAAWQGYDLDRQRAIVNALCVVTVHKARSGGNSRLAGADRPVQPGTVAVDFHR